MLALNNLSVDHRYCVRHIYSNFKSKYIGKEMKNAYWEATKATKVWAFMEEMGKISKVSENAISHLLELRIDHWYRYAWSPKPNSGLLI